MFSTTLNQAMLPDIASEIRFQTARSGGAGGQNVNKVETAVEGYWPVATSRLFSEEQKATLMEKLSNRINKEGELMVKSQVHRTQLANKEEVIKKMRTIIEQALQKKKLRIASKPSKAAKEKRLQSKKIAGEKKAFRSQRFGGDY
jgi:ribosome-associated protein